MKTGLELIRSQSRIPGYFIGNYFLNLTSASIFQVYKSQYQDEERERQEMRWIVTKENKK